MQLHHNGYRFYHWLSVSFVLHTGIVLPFVLLSMHAPTPDKRSKLQIDLFGMVSDRQAEQKKQQHASPQQPRQVSKPRPSPDAYKAVVTESPVQVKKTEEKQKPDEQSTQPIQPMQASTGPSPGASTGAASSRDATVRTTAGQGSDRNRAYVIRLIKQVRANLVYPHEMRKSGIDAVTRIAFIITKSGNIRGDSLRVQKSSGYAVMDSNALKAARDSMPFEKPPKDDFPVSFNVTFNISI